MPCDSCPLRDRKRVRGTGARNPLFVVVGEGPGAQEERVGAPFVGPSGKLLNQTLQRFRVRRDQVWTTNVMLCRPNRDGPEKDIELAVAAECCKERLVSELTALPPVPFLLLGKWAMKALIGENAGSIVAMAGSYYSTDVAGCGVREMIPTVHPAAILRGERGMDLLVWSLQYDVAKVVALARGERDVIFRDDIYVEYRNPRRAAALIDRVYHDALAAGHVALDVETTGVTAGACRDCYACTGHEATDARHARLTAVGFAVDAYAISVAWDILRPRSRARVRELLADQRVVKVAHNALYDTTVLAQQGMPVQGRIEDTFFQHHNVFPGFDHKLQRVATQFFCTPPWKSAFRTSSGSIAELLLYNARDTLATARVHTALCDLVKRVDVTRTYEMDMKMCNLAARMTAWGLPIDVTINRELAEYLTTYTEVRKEALSQRLADDVTKERFFAVLAAERARRIRKGDSDDIDDRITLRREEIDDIRDDMVFNPRATTEIAALLKACGVPLVFRTEKTGMLSVRKDVLQSFGGNSAVRAFREYVSAYKLLSTCVTPIPRLLDKQCRMHPVWSPKDITGRWASSPNVQNYSKGDHAKLSYARWCQLPEADKRMPNIRAQVVAPAGRMFVSADYKALEARIVALLSGDPYLCEAFAAGTDIHSEFSRLIFPDFNDLEPSKKSKVRDHVKRCEYAFLYGGSAETAWQTLVADGHDVPLRVVVQMFQTFEKQMPRVAAWHKSLFVAATENREQRSFLLGRRRAYPLGNTEATVVKNFPVQSAAGDIMDVGLERFDAVRDPGWLMLANGHDSLFVEVPESDVSRACDKIVRALEQEHTVGEATMCFTVEVAHGRSWDGL